MSQLAPSINLGRGPLIVGLTWNFAIIAIIAVFLRFYVRIKLSKGPSLDDWLMGAALICNIVSQSFVTIGYHYGLGKHDANLTPDQMINVLKWMWLANTPGLLVAILARISIAVLLVRLFDVYSWLRWFVIVVTAMCTILTIIIIPCTYLQSTPISANWNPYTPAKHWNPRIYIDIAFFGQALWTFSDLTFVLFPVLVIWQLQMALRQRIGVVLLMSVSLLTMAMSILKTINLSTIAKQQSDPTATDVQYNASLEILWSCLEQAFVIIMGCVPPLRAVVKLELTKSIFSSLASILRSRKLSKSSKDESLKYDGQIRQYENLAISTDRITRPEWNFGLPLTPTGTLQEGQLGSQQEMVKNDILLTTKVNSGGWDHV